MWQRSHFALLPVLLPQLWPPEPHVLPPWVPVRRKPMNSPREDAQLWLEEIFPKVMSYRQGRLNMTCSRITTRVGEGSAPPGVG